VSYFFFQAEDGIRDRNVTGVQTCALPISSGAVGSVVGQIAKLKGAYVVGIAGGPEKAKYLTDELNFDVSIDYKVDDFSEQLASRSEERRVGKDVRSCMSWQ